MLDEERKENGGTIHPDNRDSWATAYVKATALQTMLTDFIREVSRHLPVTRHPRRFF